MTGILTLPGGYKSRCGSIARSGIQHFVRYTTLFQGFDQPRAVDRFKDTEVRLKTELSALLANV